VSELINVRDVNWTIDLASLRTAFAAVATACADRD
jgi:hypothetical protein